MIKNRPLPFSDAIAALKLRFPVAEISKATGYSKSNISGYLSGTRVPSEKFLELFYETFFDSSGRPLPHANVSVTRKMTSDRSDYKDKFIETLQQTIGAHEQTIAAQKEIIQHLQDKLKQYEQQTAGRRSA